METQPTLEQLRQFELPGVITIGEGRGGLPKLDIRTRESNAEIYLHGAQVTGFQKNNEPPCLFLSRKSRFAPGEGIRGGVPICHPWFGPREGEPAHGLARLVPWELAETSAAKDGSAVVRLRLLGEKLKAEWLPLRTEFAVTVADTLTMELTSRNESPDRTVVIESCLHTYFYVGDVAQVAISGLEASPFDDFAFDAGGAPRPAEHAILRLTRETNRVYPHHAAPVEIRDASLRRTIRVEKAGSQSTVVWNPWTTQKLPDDFDPAEYQNMVCVESGNVKKDKISLAPGKTSALKVILRSRAG